MCPSRNRIAKNCKCQTHLQISDRFDIALLATRLPQTHHDVRASSFSPDGYLVALSDGGDRGSGKWFKMAGACCHRQPCSSGERDSRGEMKMLGPSPMATTRVAQVVATNLHMRIEANTGETPLRPLHIGTQANSKQTVDKGTQIAQIRNANQSQTQTCEQ